MLIESYSEMAAFAEVVEQGTFTAAAARLGVSKAHLSRQISSLEARLGVRLLRRTTRTLRLTEEGRTFHDYCRRMVETAREGLQLAQSRGHEVSGLLRISAPITYGQTFLGDLVTDFCARFPAVRVDLVLDNRHIDLLSNDFDLSFRITDHPPQTLSLTPLGVMEDVVCASPTYLRDRPRPETPTDLAGNECLLYLNPDRNRRWTFRKERRVEVVEVDGHLACNYHTALLEPLLAGLGIAKVPEYFVRDLVGSGRLVRLLEDYVCESRPIYLVHHDPLGQPPRVREFLRFAQAWLTR